MTDEANRNFFTMCIPFYRAFSCQCPCGLPMAWQHIHTGWGRHRHGRGHRHGPLRQKRSHPLLPGQHHQDPYGPDRHWAVRSGRDGYLLPQRGLQRGGGQQKRRSGRGGRLKRPGLPLCPAAPVGQWSGQCPGGARGGKRGILCRADERPRGFSGLSGLPFF